MTKTLYDLAKEVSLLLNDSEHCDGEYDFTRWSQKELANYGLSAIILAQTMYPEKFTKVVTVELVKGRVQTLPSGCSKIVKILGDANGTGAAPSTASSTDDRLANAFSFMKCGESVSSSSEGMYSVKNYTLESSSDNIFYVNPPVPFLEKPPEISVICSASPDTDPKKSHIEPWLWAPVIEFMLYRAYQSEDESQNSTEQSQMHLKNFYTLIQLFREAQMRLGNVLAPKEVTNEAA